MENGKALGVNIQPVAVQGDYMQRASEGVQGGRARERHRALYGTRRNLVCMIHSQLRPPWTHPGYRRVSDTKSVDSRKPLLNHCRTEPESEREAGA